MSDDLISREALLKRIEAKKCESKSIAELFFFDGVMAIIDTQETAFDKEKVIEELKEMQNHSESCKHQCEFASTEYFDYMGAEVAYGTAIAIVEKGGIE